MTNVLCIGCVSYDFFISLPAFPQENTKTGVNDFSTMNGGPAANAACLLAEWGSNCAFAGTVGQDTFGTEIMTNFKRAGIDTRFLAQEEIGGSTVSTIMVNRKNGSRTILTRRAHQTVYTLPSNVAFSPAYILVDGHETEASIQAMERWPEAVSVLDAGSLRESTARLSREVDYLIASATFARDFAGFSGLTSETSQEEALARLFDCNGNCAAITLGERGVIYKTATCQEQIPGRPSRTEDTTGAGDFFHGAFVYALQWGYACHQAFQLANIAAGISTENPGGWFAVPSKTQTLSELDNG